jgi:hypothetical protein
MKKLVLITVFAFALAVGASASALAQASGIAIDSPRPGEAVDGTFIMRVTPTSRCDAGPITVTDSAGLSGRLNATARQIQEGSTESTYAVDLTKPLQNGRTVETGEVTLTIDGTGDCGATVTVDYSAEEAAPVASVEPSATPTPTDSPSASPLPDTKADYTISPAVAMVIGAVAGGGAVALAEHSARRYKSRRKRKR